MEHTRTPTTNGNEDDLHISIERIDWKLIQESSNIFVGTVRAQRPVCTHAAPPVLSLRGDSDEMVVNTQGYTLSNLTTRTSPMLLSRTSFRSGQSINFNT